MSVNLLNESNPGKKHKHVEIKALAPCMKCSISMWELGEDGHIHGLEYNNNALIPNKLASAI